MRSSRLATAVGVCVMILTAMEGSSATLRVPGDAPSITAAVARAAAGDTIELTHAGPYLERLDLREAPAGLTIRAAKEVKPAIQANWALLGSETMADPMIGRLLITGNAIAIEGVRLQIDAEGVAPWSGQYAYQVAWVTRGEATFRDCTFEIFGKPLSERVLADEMVLVEAPGQAQFIGCQWSWHDLGLALPDGAAYLAARGKVKVTCEGCDFKTVREEDWLGKVRWSEYWNRWPEPPEQFGPCATAVRITGGGEVAIDACMFGGGLDNAMAAYCDIFNHGVPVQFQDCVFAKGYRRGLILRGKYEETAILERCIVQASMMDHGRFFFAQPGPPMQLLVMRNSAYHYSSMAENDMDCTRYRVAQLEQCTVADTAGLKGENYTRLMDVDRTTERLVAVRNCVIAIPAMDTTGVVNHLDEPGRPIVNAGGNLILRKGRQHESLPDGSYVEGDPKLMFDMIHLMADSPARSGTESLGLGADIDGDPRSASGRVDVGADQSRGTVGLPSWLALDAEWRDDATSNPSTALLECRRMTIHQLRREWDKVFEIGERYLAEHPDEPQLPVMLDSMGESALRCEVYMRENPLRVKIAGRTEDEWIEAKERSARQLLSITSKAMSGNAPLPGSPEDPNAPKLEEIAYLRMEALNRLQDYAGEVREADRALKEIKTDFAHEALFRLHRAMGLCRLNPPQYEAALESCEAVLFGGSERLSQLDDRLVVNTASWAAHIALNAAQFERCRRVLDLVKEYPTDLTAKSSMLMRYEPQVIAGMKARPGQ